MAARGEALIVVDQLHSIGALPVTVTCPRLVSQALCESGVGVVPL
jgi:hypothetical protein